jgi:hypothetical protein
MKKIAIFALGLMWSSIAAGSVYLRICEADGNTPFDSNMPVMVGTTLTIYVDSNSAVADWGGGLDLIKSNPDPDLQMGRLFGRGWHSEIPDYLDSHLAAAGEQASDIDWENQDQQSFELSAAGPNKAAGTWFALDYYAMNIGDCIINLMEYQGSQMTLVRSETIHNVATRDFNNDGLVDFVDFARLASYWMDSDCGALNDCGGTDLNPDGMIDFLDVAYFADFWLGRFRPQNVGETMYITEGQNQVSRLTSDGGLMLPSALNFSLDAQSAVSDEQQMTPEDNIPAIYLVYEGDMTPNPGDEVTVYVHSDTPLFCMGAAVVVTGDADIIDAMDTADCSQFGWDPSWNSEPYFESNWVYLSGVKWESDVIGTVAYVKFIYHGGEVGVSFYPEEDWNCAFDAYCEPVPFSKDTLLFGLGQ